MQIHFNSFEMKVKTKNVTIFEIPKNIYRDENNNKLSLSVSSSFLIQMFCMHTFW